ncbi:MAG: YitT family protein [Erysipelotrichaceae bacterium]|nr:YitT family protein [Erysipelotrichaceae bacterium]
MKEIKKLFDIKLLFFSLLSALIHSFAIVNFSIPASIYPAGFSGLSRISTDILYDFFNITVSYSSIYLVINIIVTLFVFKKIGKKFAIYSTVQFLMVSFFTGFFKPVITVNDIILMAMFGGIVNGCGVGLALAFNFSTGGFDFISVYFASKHKKDVWNYIFMVNVTILLIAGLIYGWERSLYSIIYQFVSTQIIKMLHQRYTQKTLNIITKYPNEVSDAILSQFRHGITEINAVGHYSKNETTILYTVVNTFQYKEIIKVVLAVDPKAFINVQNTIAVYGNYYQQPLE